MESPSPVTATSQVLTASDFIPEVLNEQAVRTSGNYSGQYWNDVIIDEMMVDPAIKADAIANKLRKTPEWVSSIRRSDSFKARYAQRRREFEADLKDKLTGKLIKVAELTLDAMSDRLEKNAPGIKMDTLKDVADSALERLGYGLKQNGPTTIVNAGTQVIVSPVSADELAEARRLMRESQAQRLSAVGQVIEGQATNVVLASPFDDGNDGREAEVSVPDVEAELADGFEATV